MQNLTNRIVLDTDDPDLLFAGNNLNNKHLSDWLLPLASSLVTRFIGQPAHGRANLAGEHHNNNLGSKWTKISVPLSDNKANPGPPTAPTSSKVQPSSSSIAPVDDDEPFEGDTVLANSALRMRDFMLQCEFFYAVSDGDIGRAMAVMDVGTTACMLSDVELSNLPHRSGPSPSLVAVSQSIRASFLITLHVLSSNTLQSSKKQSRITGCVTSLATKVVGIQTTSSKSI